MRTSARDLVEISVMCESRNCSSIHHRHSQALNTHKPYQLKTHTSIWLQALRTKNNFCRAWILQKFSSSRKPDCLRVTPRDGASAYRIILLLVQENTWSRIRDPGHFTGLADMNMNHFDSAQNKSHKFILLLITLPSILQSLWCTPELTPTCRLSCWLSYDKRSRKIQRPIHIKKSLDSGQGKTL